MSCVLGICLCFSLSEVSTENADGSDSYRNIELLNTWLCDRYGVLLNVDDQVGGTKHPQMAIVGGGFNHLNDVDFLDHFKKLKWERPEEVVLILSPEDSFDRGIQIYRPLDSLL